MRRKGAAGAIVRELWEVGSEHGSPGDPCAKMVAQGSDVDEHLRRPCGHSGGRQF